MGKKLYDVIIKNKMLKGLRKMPLKIQKKLNLLLKDLRDIGPILPDGQITVNLKKINIIVTLISAGWHAGKIKREL